MALTVDCRDVRSLITHCDDYAISAEGARVTRRFVAFSLKKASEFACCPFHDTSNRLRVSTHHLQQTVGHVKLPDHLSAISRLSEPLRKRR